MTTDLSDLLTQKNFGELTTAEQKMVLAEMSEQDYSDRREMVIAAKLMMVSEAATLQAPVLPMAVSAVVHQKKAGVLVIFAHKIPTWAAVAAGIILFTLFNYSRIFDSNTENNILAVSPQVDAVFVEKLITEFRDIKPLEKNNRPSRIKVQTTENIVSVNPSSPSNTNKILTYSDEMLNAEHVNYTALLQNHSTSTGVSLQNDSISQMVNRTVY